jgi:AcrR family transcriptional regulator
VAHENGISGGGARAAHRLAAGQRLIAAERESVRERGVAGTTFDRIFPRAGVSRGSIAWYFGTKERLLAEVLRADSDRRLARMRRKSRGRALGRRPDRRVRRAAARVPRRR